MNVQRDVDFTSTGEPATLSDHLKLPNQPRLPHPDGSDAQLLCASGPRRRAGHLRLLQALPSRLPARDSRRPSDNIATSRVASGAWTCPPTAARSTLITLSTTSRSRWCPQAAANAAAAEPTAQPSAEHARLLSHLFRALLAGRRAGLEWCRRHRAVGRQCGHRGRLQHWRPR